MNFCLSKDEEHELDSIGLEEVMAQFRAIRKSKKTSLYRGVSLKLKSKWISQIHLERGFVYLSHFTEETEAALSADRAAIACGRPDCELNFLDRKAELESLIDNKLLLKLFGTTDKKRIQALVLQEQQHRQSNFKVKAYNQADQAIKTLQKKQGTSMCPPGPSQPSVVCPGPPGSSQTKNICPGPPEASQPNVVCPGPPGPSQLNDVRPGPRGSQSRMHDRGGSDRGTLRRSSRVAADTIKPACEEDDKSLSMLLEERRNTRGEGMPAKSHTEPPPGSCLPLAPTPEAKPSLEQAIVLKIPKLEDGGNGEEGVSTRGMKRNRNGTEANPLAAVVPLKKKYNNTEAHSLAAAVPLKRNRNDTEAHSLAAAVLLKRNRNGTEAHSLAAAVLLKRNRNGTEANPLAAAVPPVSPLPPSHAPTTQRNTESPKAAGTAGSGAGRRSRPLSTRTTRQAEREAAVRLCPLLPATPTPPGPNGVAQPLPGVSVPAYVSAPATGAVNVMRPPIAAAIADPPEKLVPPQAASTTPSTAPTAVHLAISSPTAASAPLKKLAPPQAHATKPSTSGDVQANSPLPPPPAYVPAPASAAVNAMRPPIAAAIADPSKKLATPQAQATKPSTESTAVHHAMSSPIAAAAPPKKLATPQAHATKPRTSGDVQADSPLPTPPAQQWSHRLGSGSCDSYSSGPPKSGRAGNNAAGATASTRAATEKPASAASASRLTLSYDVGVLQQEVHHLAKKPASAASASRLTLSPGVGVLQQEVQQLTEKPASAASASRLKLSPGVGVLQHEVHHLTEKPASAASTSRLPLSSEVGVLQQEVQQLRQSLDVAHKNNAALVEERSKRDMDFSRVCETLSSVCEDLESVIKLEHYLQEVTDLNREQLQSKDKQIAELQQELLNQAQRYGSSRGEGGDMEVERLAGEQQGGGEDAQDGQQPHHATATTAAIDSSEQQQHQRLMSQAPNSPDPRWQQSQGQQQGGEKQAGRSAQADASMASQPVHATRSNPGGAKGATSIASQHVHGTRSNLGVAQGKTAIASQHVHATRSNSRGGQGKSNMASQHVHAAIVNPAGGHGATAMARGFAHSVSVNPGGAHGATTLGDSATPVMGEAPVEARAAVTHVQEGVSQRGGPMTHVQEGVSQRGGLGQHKASPPGAPGVRTFHGPRSGGQAPPKGPAVERQAGAAAPGVISPTSGSGCTGTAPASAGSGVGRNGGRPGGVSGGGGAPGSGNGSGGNGVGPQTGQAHSEVDANADLVRQRHLRQVQLLIQRCRAMKPVP